MGVLAVPDQACPISSDVPVKNMYGLREDPSSVNSMPACKMAPSSSSPPARDARPSPNMPTYDAEHEHLTKMLNKLYTDTLNGTTFI